jgi:hypothetical protein
VEGRAERHHERAGAVDRGILALSVILSAVTFYSYVDDAGVPERGRGGSRIDGERPDAGWGWYGELGDRMNSMGRHAFDAGDRPG